MNGGGGSAVGGPILAMMAFTLLEEEWNWAGHRAIERRLCVEGLQGKKQTLLEQS